MDALAVFVNKDNPIKCLSMSQVDALFSKSRRAGSKEDIKTWGQLGLTGEWASKPVSLYGRNSASGTYGFFKETRDEERGLQGRRSRSSRARPRWCRGSRWTAIAAGYCGIGYATAGVRAVPLSREGRGQVRGGDGGQRLRRAPTRWPRFLFVYVNKAPGKALDPLTREFVKLMVSKEGQEGVIKDGYFPIPASIAKEELTKVQ